MLQWHAWIAFTTLAVTATGTLARSKYLKYIKYLKLGILKVPKAVTRTQTVVIVSRNS